MNLPPHVPPDFDALQMHLDALQARRLPDHTVDPTPDGAFSRPFLLSDIAWAKARVKRLYLRGAVGVDGVSYRQVLVMSNRRMLYLSTSAFGADNYRIIGLECCLLKLLTLLVERRLRTWAENNAILPPSQNGFREASRATNNLFVLRAAVEKARALQRTIYVVFLDLTNAFSSANQPTLWLKLARMGASGPLID
ncbi:hypothetical protein OBBRIDRAFT_696891, partial [Obba rivulosa]